jgi:hypothetical protein
MLQRVPRYRSLLVNGTLTADAWNGEKGGVFFVKVLQSTEVVGTIDMDNKGYRKTDFRAGESYTGPAVAQFTANGGGGSGNTYQCGGGQYIYYQTIGGGGSYGTQGSVYVNNGSTIGGGGEAGATYGALDLAKWFLGSAGGTTTRQRCYNGNYNSYRSQWVGGNGGGALMLWSNGLSVRGNVRARNSGGTLAGSGGSIFLRARSMNVGNNRVQATASSRGGSGRIRLDFFGLSGTTTPAFHPGFAGDTVVQTSDLSGVGNPVASVTLRQSLEDRRGGTIGYRVSNGATNDDQELIWHPIAPGETVNFPQNQPGTALRVRATFSNDNLQPLALIGLSLGWSRTP